jgi:parallel beta-helix repeat protein
MCSAAGLVVGADNITIDGGSHALTGGNGVGLGDSYGVDSEGHSNVIIQNFGTSTYPANLGISKFYEGINLVNSTNNTILNNITNANRDSGIYLSSSPNNILTGNTTNLSYTGIDLINSGNNHLNANSAGSNSVGIYLQSSSGDVMTGNRLAGNRTSIWFNNNSDSLFNSTIDATNMVEGKPVIYLYNIQGTQSTPIVYSGDIRDAGKGYAYAGDIGMFNCISCKYVTLKNAVISPANTYGVFLRSSPYSSVINVTANSNGFAGIYLISSPYSTLTGNTVNYGNVGISLTSSGTSTITNNHLILNNGLGISLASSGTSTITNNLNLMNRNDFSDDQASSSVYQNNQSLHNATSTMLSFSETSAPGIKSVNGTVSFAAAVKDLNRKACASCTVISIFPPEPSFVYSDNGNGSITGSFSPTRTGIYSLDIKMTDPGGNTNQRDYSFFVGTTTTKTVTYYYRGVDPTHNQPVGRDAKSLLLTAPTATEEWRCSVWVQNSPDDMPDYPFASLSSINSYKWSQTNYSGSVGIQRHVTYDGNVDFSQFSYPPRVYGWVSNNFPNLNWVTDYPTDWYQFTLKSVGMPIFITTFPSSQAAADPSSWAAHHHADGSTDPSGADFTYSYTTTPAIKSISNPYMHVLSATTPYADASSTTLVLDGSMDAALGGTGSTSMVFGDPKNGYPFRRPFMGYASTISSDGTTTLAATGITGTTTINSVPLDITPSAGQVAVTINKWNVSGDYSKEWVETGDTPTATSTHIVGNLKADSYYSAEVDNGGVFNGLYRSNDSGQIAFTYTGGYSTHTFDIIPFDVSQAVPSVSLTLPLSGSTVSGTSVALSAVATSTDPTGIVGIQFMLDGTVNIGSMITSTSSPNTYSTTWDSTAISAYGSHTLYAVTLDGAGNHATSTVTVNVSLPPSVPATVTSFSTGGGTVSPAVLAKLLVPGASTTAYLNSLNKVPSTVVAVPNAFVSGATTVSGETAFDRSLAVGNTGNDVKTLQEFLNTHGFTIASKGAGSPGHETKLFGSLTKKALVNFQKANDITPAIGFFGPITRAKINMLLGK